MMRPWPAKVYRRRVILKTRVGDTFRGVVWTTDGDWLTLRDVQYLADGAVTHRLTGDVLIERSNVNFIEDDHGDGAGN